MRLIITRVKAGPIRVYADDMGTIMLYEITHALLQNLVRHPLAQREHVLDGVMLFLVESTALNANSVDDEGGERKGHPHFLIFLLRLLTEEWRIAMVWW